MRKRIILDKRIILETPIGEIEIVFLEEARTGDKNVLRIANNDNSFILLPIACNTIYIKKGDIL